MAVGVGVFGLALWGEQPALPLVRVPVPMRTLVPVLTTILLTWPLHERWPQQMATAARHPLVVPVGRFLGTQATCATGAGIASLLPANPASSVIALSSIGASVAAVCTLALGSRTVFALLPGAYLWLSAAANPANLAAASSLSYWLAPLTLVGCGAFYVWWQARRFSCVQGRGTCVGSGVTH